MELVRLVINKFRDMILMCIPGSKNWERTFSEVHLIALFVSLVIFMPGLATAQNCTLNANVDQVICANEVLTLAGSKGGLFQGTGVSTWSQISGPSAIIVSPNSLITTVTGIQSNSTYKFRLSTECQDGSLVYDDVVVTVKPVTFANAGADQGPMCPGNGTLLANVAGANETGSWSIVGNNDAGISINNPNSINTGFTAAADDAGTSTLRWTIKNANGCVAYDDMTITNLGAHLIVNAGPDQVLGNCFSLSTTTTLAATFGGNNIAGQTGLWTVISGPNIPTITSPTRRNSTVTNLIQGVYILRWTVTGPCSNGFDEVKISVPAPVGSATSTAITPGNDVYCDGRTSMVFSGTYPLYNNEVVNWTQTAGPPATIVSPNSPTTSISGLDATSNYTFRYTISNPVTGCSSTTTSSIVYATAPSLAITTPSPLIAPCNSNSATISFTQAGTGPVEYSIVSAPAGFPGVPTAYAPLGASPATISGLTLNGTYVIQLRKSAFGSGCADVFQSITVITSVTPSNSNGGTKQLLGCNITSTALVGNVPAIGTGSWSQVSGPNAAVIASPNNPGTNISGLVNGLYRFRWKISGGPACPTRQNDAQVVVSSVAPTTANAGPDQTVCFNTPVYLAGNAPILNETGTWTVSPSAGVVFSPDANTRNAVVTGLVASTVYTFTWTINNACGPGSSDQVKITTTSTEGPVASVAGNDQCLPTGTNSITLAANDPGAGSGAWTKLSGPAATFTNPALRNTSVTGLTDGTYQFIWTITFGSCAVSRDTVMVTISQPATMAVVGNDQNICGTTATLTANTPTIGTGTWSQEAGAGGVTITSPLAATSSVTGLTAGTYIFRWNISNNACPGTMDSVQINVSDVAPVAPNAGPDKSVCGLSTCTMAANNVAPGTGLWSLVSGPNAPVFSDMKSPTATISGLEAGVYIFRWTSYGGEFCNPLSDDVKIDVTPAANAGPDQSKCFANSANLIGNDGSVGTWSQVGTTPNVATIIPTTSYSAIASGLIAGTYTFRYTVAANGSCATPSADDMTVTIFTATSAASAGPDQEHCDVTSFNLAANDPAPYTGTWTKVAGPAGGSFSPNANSPVATFTGASPGVYIFSWTISNASCSSVDEVRITNYATPTVAAAGPDQVQVCGTVATMAGNLPVNGLGNWSLVSKPAGAPDPSITSPILPNTNITNLVPVSYPGTYVFRWTISNGSCTSFSDDVAITVYQQPTIANAGPDQVLCNVSAVTLAGNQPLIGTGNWAKVSGPAAIITSPSSYNTTVTGMTPGVYVFEWTTTNLPCSTSDQVTITIDALPTPASTAGTPTDVCLFSPMNLVGNVPLTGTGSWSQSGGAAVTILNPASATASVAGAAVGNYSFLYTVSNGSCPISTSSVSINVAQVPTMALAGADQSVCNTSTTSFAGNTPDPGQGTGTWTQLSGPAAVISDPNNPTSTVTLSAAGSYRFKWEIATNAACTSSDQVVIVKNSDVAVTAPANVTICNGGVASMSVTASGGTPPYTYQWQQSINGISGWTNVSGGSGATFNTYTTVALASDMYYRCVVTCACGSEISAASLVTVVPDPVIAAQPTASTTICSGQTTSLSVTAGGGTPSLTYQWQSNTSGCAGAWTNIAGATNPAYTTAALTQTTYYRVLVNASGNGCNTATSNCATVFVPRIITQPAAYAICTGGVGTLTVKVDAGSSTLAYQWQESSDNSSWSNVSSGTGANAASYTSGVLTSNMYYRCIVTVTSPDCGTLVSNSALITVVPDPTVTGQPVSPAVICVGGTTANMVVTATGGTPALIYRWQYFNGTTWNNVANGTPSGASYAGWNSATFRVGGISTAGSYQYRCQISATGNDCNTTYSDPVTVTTIPDPVLTTPVFTVPTMCAGGTTVVSSTISGGIGVPTFQWQYLNGATWVNVANGTPAGTVYTNANTLTMTISGASGAGVKQYRLYTNNSSGCDFYSPSDSYTVVADPNITAQPSNAAICVGGINTLSVGAAGGTPILDYQWRTSSDNISFTDIPGATSSTYTTPVLNTTNYYKVYISATGEGCGNVTSASTTVTVVPDPYIITQPNDAVICTGGNNTLSVTAAGGTPFLIYQWQSSTTGGAPWTNVGASSNTYTTPALLANTYYRVVISATGNDCNTVTSDPALITVVPDPTVDVQPVGTTLCSGGTHTMSVTASGDPLTGALLYQWQSGPNAGSYTNIAGANSSTYTTGPLASTTYFRCVISQAPSGCSTYSADAVVTVVADPNFTTSPSGLAICTGGAHSMSVVALGGTPSLSYQWQLSSDNTSFTDIPGATTTSYATGVLTSTTYYRVNISATGVGCNNATSATATVTVVPDPAITTQPVNAVVCNGGTNTLKVTATGGTPSLNYQWQSSPTGGAPWTNVGSNSNTYTTPALSATTYYQVVVTATGNDCNTVVSNVATVTVVPDPSISIQPAGATICTGGNHSMSVSASGDPSAGVLLYQWQSGPNTSSYTNIAGANSNSYTTGALAASTYFRCIITQAASGCSVTSSDVTVSVVADPSVTTQPTSPAAICVGGTTANITIAAAGGTPSLVYQWEYNNGGTWSNVANGLPAGAVYTGANATTFAVAGISSAGSYQYRCFVSAAGNGCGTATSNIVTVTVVADPAITTQPASPAAICVGGTTANMILVASGGTPSLGYQWQFFNGTTWNNVANGTPTGSVYTGAATTTFSVAGINATGNYLYRCLVTATGNDCNTTTSNTVTVTVNSPAVFSQCPSNITQNTDPNQCSAVVNYAATATGVPAPLITYTLSGATVASGSGTGSGTAFNKGVTNVLLTATNSCSTVTCSFKVTINDAELPVITTCPPTRNIDGCSTTAITGPVYSPVSAASTETEFENATNHGVASDNCGITSVTYSDAVTGSCPITVTRTWVLKDAAGNTATCAQDIKIADNTAPVVICKNITVALNAGGTASITAADINNGSTDNCGIASVVASKTSFTCSDIGPNTVTLTVTDNCGHVSTCDAVVTVTDPNAPTLTINDVTVNESAGTATFKVMLSNTRSCDVAFTVNTSDNSAKAGSDYTAVSSAVYTIPAGSSFVNISIPVLSDNIAEPAETYNVNLSAAIYATISDASGLGTILDDDAVSLSLSGFTVTETNTVQTQNFVVSLNTPAEKDITISFTTSNGTALSGSDYIAQSSVSYTIPAGTTTINIPVGVQGDQLSEPAENFSGTIVISNANGQDVSVATGNAVSTINDDDLASLAINDVVVNENAGTATFTVTLTGGIQDNVSVNYATGNGTAVQPGDYTAVSGTLAFAAGSPGGTTKTITVPIINDLIGEPSENFTVLLSGLTSTSGVTLSDASGLGTITDNDAVTIALSGFSVTETNGTQTQNFVVTLSNAAQNNIVLNFSTANSSALSGSDYTAQNSVSYTIPAGATTLNIPVSVLGDLLAEPTETFTGSIVLTNANGQDVSITTASATATILDNDAASIAINDVAVNESAGTATFTVTLTGAIQDAVTVNYATANGTAVQPADYTAVSGSVTFAAGSASGSVKTITVPIINDLVGEPTENYTVTLSGLVGTGNTTLSDASGLGTITDDDALTLALSGFTITETNGSQTGNFVVTLNTPAEKDIVITFSTTNGTATGGSDFTAQTTVSYTIPAGSTTLNIPVNILGDLVTEPAENFTGNVSISNANGQNISISVATAISTINDNDAASVAINDMTVNENAGTATFTVTLTGNIQGSISVDYATANGTAVQPADYTAAAGTITFPAGSATGATRTITVPIINDLIGEATENYTVLLSNISGSGNISIGVSTGLGTITDDDAITLSLSGFAITETNGTQPGNFVVTLSNAVQNDIIINFTTTGNTALAASDFTGQASISYTIPAGTTSYSIPVEVLGDLLAEPTETFAGSITLTNANGQNISITTATATATILDNDAASIAINDVTVNESAGNATFTITLTGAIQDALTVNYATANGTAVQPADYTSVSGSVTFAAGSASGSVKTITVPIINDLVGEPTENYTVTLSGLVATGNTSISDASGVGTITDDDAVTLTLSGFTVTETNGIQVQNFVIALNTAAEKDVTITFSTANGSAVAGNDFTSQSAVSYTIPAGATSFNIPVTVLGDLIAEPAETFTGSIVLSNANGQNVSITTSTATASISDNDAVSIAINDVTVNENAGTAVFTVTLTGAVQDALTVNYATANGTAIQPGDYTSASGLLTFNAGSANGATQTISIPIINDLIGEPAENYSVILSNLVNSGNATVSKATGNGVINDDDDVALNLSGFTVTETNGAQTQNFVVTLGAAAQKDIEITFSTANLTATASSDFTGQSVVTYTIPAGSTSFTIPVEVLGDQVAEPTETFKGIIAIANANGQSVSIATASATSVILDNDAVSIAINDVSVNESAGMATFTVTLTGNLQDALTVDYSSLNGTAVQPSDYTTSAGTLTFPAGSLNGATKTISVPIISDLLGEPTENFSIVLQNIVNSGVASISDNTGLGTILDDDAVTLSLSGFVVTEINGTQIQNYVITLSTPAEKDIVINFSTANASALAGSDYTAQTAVSYTIPAGTTSFNIPVEILGDLVSEPTESFSASMSLVNTNGVNAGIGNASAISTILDSGSVSVSINDVTVNESAGTATFTITLTGTIQDALTVNFATANGTALDPADYASISGMLTFGAGSVSGTTKTISVPIVNDLTGEPTETFTVNLSGLVSTASATIADATGVATILDNDALTLSLSGFSVTETNSTQTKDFVVTLNTAAQNDIIISFITANLTAVSDKDYTAPASVSYTIPAGSTNFNIPVDILGDQFAEPSESFTGTIAVTNADGQNVNIDNATATAVILDDDAAGIAINDVTVNENAGTATFTVTLTGAIQDVLRVSYATTNGTALQPTDYIAGSGVITFPAASVSGAIQSITVPIVNDAIGEPTETYTVNLSNLAGTGDVTLSDNSGLGTIVDDESLSLSLNGFTVTEINGTQTQNFIVSLNAPSEKDIVIVFTTTDGSAIAGSDYTAQNAVSYTIPAGSTSIDIPVEILGDLVSEPNESFTGTIAISDAAGLGISISSATAIATIIDNEIIAVDDAVITINGYTGGVAIGNVLLNDLLYGTYPTTADVIMTQISSLDPNGNPTMKIRLKADGSVTVDPGTAAGIYHLTYMICEAIHPSNCTQAVVTINVTAAAIDALADAGTANGMTGGQAVSNVLDNDQLNGTAIHPAEVTITLITPAADPHIVLNPATGEVTVAPGTPSGTYTITYQVCEILNPANCDQAIVTISVTAAPVLAANDAGSVSGINGGTAVADVLANDLLNGNAVNPSDVIISLISSTNSGVSLAGSSVVVAPGTPAGVYYLVYQVCEVLNMTNCSEATATITVTNDAPVANGISVITAEDKPITVCIPVTDADAGSVFTATICGNPAHGSLGTPVVTGNQVCITYSPDPNYNGADNFCIQVCDNGKPALCDTALIAVNVTPVNDAPVVTGLTITTTEDNLVTVCLPIADPDAGSVFTASVCGNPAHGTLSAPEVTGDQVCFTYTPNTNYHGIDQVCIQVCDNGSPVLCDTALINIEVISVNDAPITVNEHETTCNTSAISGNLLANGDNDPDGSALTATLVQLSGPAHGTFSIQANGDYTYTPELTYSGPDQVVISVCDNAIPQPVRCTNDTLFINVVPSVLLTAGRDTAICEKAATFRLDGAAAQHFTTIHWTSSGKGTFDDASLVNPTYTPAAADIASGSVILTMSGTGITPCGEATDALTLAFAPAPTANAGNDETFCNSASFKVQHASAANYTSLLWEYTPAYSGTLSDVATLSPTFTPAADFTGNVILTLKAMGNPVCGAEMAQDQMTLTIVTGISLSAGANQVIPTGTATTLHGTASGGSGAYAWSWESSASLVNPVVATPQTLALTKQTSFVLTVLDMISGCSAQDQTVVSIALTAVNDTDTTGVNTPAVIPVLSNDAVPGRESIAVTICGNPTYGSVTVNSDNTITYTPTDKYIGDDKFCYMICDNGDPAVCDTATVFIRVKARVDNLLIFNLITPNNDNSNDGWIIRGIEDYPDNTVVIFNRWGDKVKELTGYDNKDVVWDGTNTKGEVLPSGTYYYILTIDNVGSRTGWIYLQGKEK